jgi:outer membrane protein OmpA-like peptidoglycan-associated protein
VLTAVRDALVAEPEIKRVSIEGHTDDRGGDKHNLDLSDRRAKSVRRWMIEHGIAPERLEAHGFGETRPVVDNRASQGRATNRRVEFRIVE